MGQEMLQTPFTRFGPPPEIPLRKTLLAKPVPLAIIDERFNGGASPIAEDEKGAGKGIALEHIPAYPAQSINAVSEIQRLYGHQDPHLGCNLDHRPSPKKTLASSSGSNSRHLQDKVIFSLSPPVLSNSTL